MNEETPDQYDMWPSKETHESVGIHMTDFNFSGDYDGDRKMDDLKFFYRAYIADALSGGCMEKDKDLCAKVQIFLENSSSLWEMMRLILQ
ncbi:protein TIC110, chloroplastic [Tanacetum coccineum]